MFRKMTCSKVENHFALPLLEKGQRLVIMIPHKACSERQKGKGAMFEITDFRAGTNLKSLLVLPQPSGRLVGLISEMRQLRHKEGMNLSDTTCD